MLPGAPARGCKLHVTRMFTHLTERCQPVCKVRQAFDTQSQIQAPTHAHTVIMSLRQCNLCTCWCCRRPASAHHCSREHVRQRRPSSVASRICRNAQHGEQQKMSPQLWMGWAPSGPSQLAPPILAPYAVSNSSCGTKCMSRTTQTATANDASFRLAEML